MVWLTTAQSKWLPLLLGTIAVVQFDTTAARVYARLPFKRTSLYRLIAAHTLSNGLIMVPNNTKDFADVHGLRIENWATA